MKRVLGASVLWGWPGWSGEDTWLWSQWPWRRRRWQKSRLRRSGIGHKGWWKVKSLLVHDHTLPSLLMNHMWIWSAGGASMGWDAFPVSAHLPPSFARLPLHSLIYHELHSRVEYKYEGGECAVPQCSHTLVGYDLWEGVWGGQNTSKSKAESKPLTLHSTIYS